jgi:hypothetical protein
MLLSYNNVMDETIGNPVIKKTHTFMQGKLF